MDTTSRMQAFLARLWELQAEAGLMDKDLAARMHVDPAMISRAKGEPAQSFGMKFYLGACEAFPELRFFLFEDCRILNSDVRINTDEGAA